MNVDGLGTGIILVKHLSTKVKNPNHHYENKHNENDGVNSPVKPKVRVPNQKVSGQAGSRVQLECMVREACSYK